MSFAFPFEKKFRIIWKRIQDEELQDEIYLHFLNQLTYNPCPTNTTSETRGIKFGPKTYKHEPDSWYFARAKRKQREARRVTDLLVYCGSRKPVGQAGRSIMSKPLFHTI